MIIVKIHGGLGNQMFQYATAKSLALHKHDSFRMDISSYHGRYIRNFELNEFDIAENYAQESEYKSLLGRRGPWNSLKKGLSRLSQKPRAFHRQKNPVSYEEKIFNYENFIYIEGYWQNECYFKGIEKALRKDFSLRAGLNEKANEYLNRIKESNSISIHIRRGDYISDPSLHRIHGVCNMEYYKKSLNWFLERKDNPCFFIFSDDITWCRNNLSFAQNATLIENAGGPAHEMELMRHCRHHIIANSTFSWWSAWLNPRIDKHVLCPSQWFLDRKYAHLHPAPETWLRL